MKYAIVNNEKVEATTGAKGVCPSCGSELIAKCGDLKVNHWSHKGNRNCDPWWENETEWHRSWKINFPKEWQEVTHTDEKTGEKHIADVKTDGGWILEFQHSYIESKERHSRNSFYPKLVWVVDGIRRQRDKPQFYRILDDYAIRAEDTRFKGIIGPDECKLLKEWHDNNAHVFFDFQDQDDEKQPILWYLFPRLVSNEAYLWPFSRDKFIELHINNKFDALVENEIRPFLEKLINKKKIMDAMEESRHQERLSRLDWIKVGRRGHL